MHALLPPSLATFLLLLLLPGLFAAACNRASAPEGEGTERTDAPRGGAGGEEVVRVTGTLTDEGVECPAMRGDDGTLYTLTGADLAPYETGDRLVVEGTRAGISFCMQGTTLAVTSVQRADP